jgi:hypothetical protein
MVAKRYAITNDSLLKIKRECQRVFYTAKAILMTYTFNKDSCHEHFWLDIIIAFSHFANLLRLQKKGMRVNFLYHKNGCQSFLENLQAGFLQILLLPVI